MINLTEFKISNLSGAPITLASLDNFVLISGAVDIDVFDAANGNFGLSDVQQNTEIESLLQAGSISAKDQDNGVFDTTFPLYGHMYTVLTATPPATTQANWNPAGWNNAKVIKISPAANQFFTGFQKTYHGDFKIIRNESNKTMTFLYNNSASLLENRIFPIERTTNNNKKYSAVLIQYDAVEQKWKSIDAEKP